MGEGKADRSARLDADRGRRAALRMPQAPPGFEHTGWRCEHHTLIKPPDADIANFHATCTGGCLMQPVYAATVAGVSLIDPDGAVGEAVAAMDAAERDRLEWVAGVKRRLGIIEGGEMTQVRERLAEWELDHPRPWFRHPVPDPFIDGALLYVPPGEPVPPDCLDIHGRPLGRRVP